MKSFVLCNSYQILFGLTNGEGCDGRVMCHVWKGERVPVVKPEKKGPLGRRRHRWENNIQINIEEMRRDRVDCVIQLKLRRSARCCERGDEHSVCVKCGELNVQVNTCRN
jgi:hypothetical protein